MSTICCERCARARFIAVRYHLDHGTELRPCTCACHNVEHGEPARGVVFGLLMVVLPWALVGYLIWRALP